VTTIDQMHSQSTNEGHRLMPTVFTLEEGQPITSKAVGPGALYVIEGSHLFYGHICHNLCVIFNIGEFVVEDTADPEKPVYLTAGDVILIDEGTVNKTSTPSKGRGKLSRNSSSQTVTYLQIP